jgi:hypothetical protein
MGGVSIFLKALAFIALVVGSASCSQTATVEFVAPLSGSPGGPGGGGGGAGSSYKAYTDCAEGELRVSPSESRRLSRIQYEEYLVAALSSSAPALIRWNPNRELVWRDRYPVGALAVTLSQVPQDQADRTFSRTDSRFTESHFEGYFAVADQAAEYFLANTTDLTALIRAAVISGSGNPNSTGQCLTTPAEACVKHFFQGLSQRFLSRPLDTDEENRYWTAFSATWAGMTFAERFTVGLRAMMLHPEFLFVVQNRGLPVAGRPGLIKKTPFEVARELALRFEDGPPVAVYGLASQAAAQQRDIDLNAAIAALVAHSGNNNCQSGGACDASFPLSKSAFVGTRFALEHLEFDRFPWFGSDVVSQASYNFCFTNSTGGCIFFGEQPLAGNANYYRGMEVELQRLAFSNFWANRSYASYLRDPSYVLSGGDSTNRIYGYSTPPAYGTPVDERPGPITRAGFLNSGGAYPNMIQLGTKMLRKFVCRNLPDPNVALLPEGFRGGFARHSPPVNTSDYVMQQTADPACTSCHALINPMGQLFAGFDGIGRSLFTHPLHYSGQERVFSPNGGVAGYVAVNPSATIRLDGEMRTFSSVQDFIDDLASSEEGQVCFARQLFEFGFGRKATPADACTVKEVYGAVRDGAMKDAWKAMGRAPAALYRVVAP